MTESNPSTMSIQSLPPARVPARRPRPAATGAGSDVVVVVAEDEVMPS